MSLLSIVIPVLNEEQTIEAVIQRIERTLQQLGHTWEIIIVDDGSTDKTLDIVAALAEHNPRLKALSFSRNFGSHVAITAGLEHSQGEAALVITADLEEPPELFAEFIEKWQAGDEIVWGIRTKRHQNILSRTASSLFHWLFKQFGGENAPPLDVGGGFFLVDRKALDILPDMQERNRTIIGLLFWGGFKHSYVTYQQQAQQGRRSRWTLSKKIKLAVDYFTAFSYVPIRMFSFLGLFIAAMSMLYGLHIIIFSIVKGSPVIGWPTIMVVLLFFFGIQFIFMGVLGEYLWRALDESRKRPLYIVREKIGI